MPFFEGWREGSPENHKPKKEKPGQLLQIIFKIRRNPQIYSQIIERLAERNPEKFRSVREAQRYFDSVSTNLDAAGLARIIDYSFGAGTFRILSFLDEKQDRARSVSRLLQRNIENTSFEHQMERGHYLNLLETYGVSWDLEKTSRDCVQNFFDANGQTLDGVKIETEVGFDPSTQQKTSRVLIESDQDYDWRELIHFGGTTKGDSETAVGGFGEGLKIAAFILLKDQGATRVRAASRDWQIDYYFNDVSAEAYRSPVKGLFAKKSKRGVQPGNYLEIIFEGDDAEKKAQAFIEARNLFYSSENPDFQNPSFDNRSTGGFQILAPAPEQQALHFRNRKGHLYIAGQRIHYDSRDQWETVSDLNIWTWKKIEQRDRDRGLITRHELTRLVFPMIVESMNIEDLKKSVYDFKPLWDNLGLLFAVSGDLLKLIVNKLYENNVKLEFEERYLANDLPMGAEWIRRALEQKGYRLCPEFMSKIGMKGALDQFRDWQHHFQVETTPQEAQKIAILQKAAQIIGLPDEDLKPVWLFDRENENSIMVGQYNPEFYWMSNESLNLPLIDALQLYVHEAAHKAGPHGQAKFDYTLEEYGQKIKRFFLEHPDEWRQLENEWQAT